MEQGDLSLADSKSLKRDGEKASSQQGKGAGFEIGSTTSSGKKILSDLEIESLGQKLKGSTNPIDKRLAFSQLLQGLTAENALLIRDQIKDFDAGSPEFKEFHYAWGAVGGTDAVMFGVDTVEPDMSPALSGWASSDPQKAIEKLENIKKTKANVSYDEARLNYAQEEFLNGIDGGQSVKQKLEAEVFSYQYKNDKLDREMNLKAELSANRLADLNYQILMQNMELEDL